MIEIRLEKGMDISRVHKINEEAFGQPAEADIVDELRNNCHNILSLVAEEDRTIVGHILFSPVVVDNEDEKIDGMGLAPMAVMPDRQKRGIGSKLVRFGLDILKNSGCPFVIVLGHPEYYPKFGFEPASKYGIRCQWDGVPDKAFMIIFFDQNKTHGIHGVAKYRDEFNDAM